MIHFAIAENATGKITGIGETEQDIDFIGNHWPVPASHTLYTYDAPLPLPLPEPFDDYQVVGGFVVVKSTFGIEVSVIGGGGWLANGVSTLRCEVTGLAVGDVVNLGVGGPPNAGQPQTVGESVLDFTTSEAGAYRIRVWVTNASGGKKQVLVFQDAI